MSRRNTSDAPAAGAPAPNEHGGSKGDAPPVKYRCSICQMQLPDGFKEGDRCPSCGNFGPGVKPVPVEPTKGDVAVMHVEKLDVRTGDVVIFRTPISPKEVNRMFDQVADHLAQKGITNVKMLTVPPGVLIEQLGDDDLRAMGLQRIPAQ